MKRIILLAMILGTALMGCEAKIQTQPSYPAPTYRPPTGPGWRTLASAYSADSVRQFINLEGRGGEFRWLRIQGVNGAPLITQVAIEYMDRSMQVVDLGVRLARGQYQDIQLRGRYRQRINRIIVYTDPMRGGGLYSVYGI